MKDDKKTRDKVRDDETLSTNGNDEGGEDMETRPHFRNATELSRFIGVDRKEIPRLVRIEGLPARKIRGRWQALRCDVRPWIIDYIRGK